MIEKWEGELGSQLDEQQMVKVMRAVRDYATDMKTIEMNYKCLVRWYITPEKKNQNTNKINPHYAGEDVNR